MFSRKIDLESAVYLDQVLLARLNWSRSLKVEEVEVQPPKMNIEWEDAAYTAQCEYRLLTPP